MYVRYTILDVVLRTELFNQIVICTSKIVFSYLSFDKFLSANATGLISYLNKINSTA
jgi:hypothetical protein